MKKRVLFWIVLCPLLLGQTPASRPNEPVDAMKPTWPQEWELSFSQVESWREDQIQDTQKKIESKSKALRTGIPEDAGQIIGGNGFQIMTKESGPPKDRETRRKNSITWRKELSELRRKLKRLQSEEAPDLPEIRWIKMGVVGPIERVEVVQVLGKKESRVKLSPKETLIQGPNGWETTKDIEHESFWITDVDTTGWSDGSKVNLDRWFIVSKTKTYTTSMQVPRTEFLAEPINQSTWEQAYIQWRKQKSTVENGQPGPIR